MTIPALSRLIAEARRLMPIAAELRGTAELRELAAIERLTVADDAAFARLAAIDRRLTAAKELQRSARIHGGTDRIKTDVLGEGVKRDKITYELPPDEIGAGGRTSALAPEVKPPQARAAAGTAAADVEFSLERAIKTGSGSVHDMTLPRAGGEVSFKIQRGTAEGKVITVEGRTLLIQDEYVSATHAQIRWDPKTRILTVIDSGSSNGTFLNGRRIRGTQTIDLSTGGASVKFGHTTFNFRMIPEGMSYATLPAARRDIAARAPGYEPIRRAPSPAPKSVEPAAPAKPAPAIEARSAPKPAPKTVDPVKIEAKPRDAAVSPAPAPAPAPAARGGTAMMDRSVLTQRMQDRGVVATWSSDGGYAIADLPKSGEVGSLRVQIPATVPNEQMTPLLKAVDKLRPVQAAPAKTIDIRVEFVSEEALQSRAQAFGYSGRDELNGIVKIGNGEPSNTYMTGGGQLRIVPRDVKAFEASDTLQIRIILPYRGSSTANIRTMLRLAGQQLTSPDFLSGKFKGAMDQTFFDILGPSRLMKSL